MVRRFHERQSEILDTALFCLQKHDLVRSRIHQSQFNSPGLQVRDIGCRFDLDLQVLDLFLGLIRFIRNKRKRRLPQGTRRKVR